MRDFITYLLLRLKNYLKLPIVNLNSPHEEAVPYQPLADAMVDYASFDNKKNNKNQFYSTFLTVIVSALVSIIHSSCSPFFSSNISLANAGTVVVKDPATDCIFVLYFNSIPPMYVFLYINTLIYLLTNIYNYLYRNLYILVS